MSEKRIINYEATDSFASDDYLLLDGLTNGTRRLKASILKNNQTMLNIEKLWRKTNTGEPIYSSPIVDYIDGNEVIAYQSWDWYGYVIDSETGETIWRRPFSAPLYGKPVSGDVNNDGDTEFIFASHAGEIRCYDKESNLLWEQFDEFTRNGHGVVEAIEAEGDTTMIVDETHSFTPGLGIRNPNRPEENAILRIGNNDYNIVQVNEHSVVVNGTISASQGNEFDIVPRYDSDKIFQHAGVLVNENETMYLYITGMDFCCRKINAETGEIVWVYATGEAIEPMPYVYDLDNDGDLECVFVSVDWYVYCVDASSGELLWRFATGGGNDAFINSMPKGDGTRLLMIPSRDGHVYMLNSNGTLYSKTTNTCADIDCGATRLNDDTFVVGGDSGNVWRFNKDGESLWRHSMNAWINSTPITFLINSKEYFLASTMDGTVKFFESDTGNECGALYCQGSVEGTPLALSKGSYADIIITTCNGYVEKYRITNKEE